MDSFWLVRCPLKDEGSVLCIPQKVFLVLSNLLGYKENKKSLKVHRTMVKIYVDLCIVRIISKNK